MRKLASFDDALLAEDLCEVLFAADIASELRPGPEDTRVVWIVAEPDVERARTILQEFIADPDNARYEAARATAMHKRDAIARAERVSRHKVVKVRETFRARAAQSPVTAGLLIASIAVALATRMGSSGELLRYLSIVDFERMGGFLRWSYDDLAHGQLWRLFTPILIHFGPFHLLFNAFWLNDLAIPTERYQGSWRFLGFVLLSAAVSNLAQLYFGHSPNFGGLSGVIYALVGYLWARGRADPQSGIAMPARQVWFFVVWMLLGFAGVLVQLVGQMANFCHLGGFAAGALYGYIAALIAVSRRRR